MTLGGSLDATVTFRYNPGPLSGTEDFRPKAGSSSEPHELHSDLEGHTERGNPGLEQGSLEGRRRVVLGPGH